MSCLSKVGFLGFLLTVTASGFAGTDSDFDWVDDYRDEIFVLRPSINANPFIYLPIVEDLATLEMRGSFLPLMGSERVTVTGVDLNLKQGVIVFDVENDHGEKGRFRFIAPKNSKETMGKRHIDGLLNLVTEDSGAVLHVLNESSGTLHFSGSNHGHRFLTGREFAGPKEALAKGFKLCPACYSPIHLLPEYEKEMAMGRLIAVEIRNSYPAVLNDSLQIHVQSVGRKVLNNWPVPLRGYGYRFSVVDAPSSNAVACPGGWIFIYKGLLELCESDLELESVLAHEVSHVEMRHGLRQLHSAEKAARIGAIAGALIVGIAASQDNSAVAIAGGIALLVSNTAIEIALAGYSREMEMESDAAAVHYLINNRGAAERNNLAQILAKMEYMGECETGHHSKSNSLSSHPSDNIRSDFAANAEVVFFDAPVVFTINNDENSNLEVQIFGFSHHAYFLQDRFVAYEDQHAFEFGFGGAVTSRPGEGKYLSDTRVFLAVTAGSGIKRGMEFKDVEILIDGHWVDFDNKEDTELYPNTTISMALSRRQSGIVRFNSLVPTKVKFSGRSAEVRERSGMGLH